MWTTFSALLNGAALYPFDIKEQGVADLATWLNTEDITIYISAATIFRHFVRTLTGEDFLKLRLIKLGGEPVRKSDVELYKEYFSPRCVLVNVLSSTETGNFSHYFIDKQTEITTNIVPVGYAVEDMEVLLLDEAGGEVRRGYMGEIAIKSRYLSPGYWRKPGHTRAAFSSVRGSDERIYRTGDLGRMRADGCLEHLGRKDFQVKIRGFRVELGEIEAVLGEHPAVQETALASRKDVSGDNSLVAYLVPAPGQAPTTGELRGYLREHLPEHMVPSRLVFLDTLPLTPMGKVDRRALPAPEPARSEPEASSVGPRSPIEEALAGIWEDVLHLPRVSIDDDFFELGGHSLLAMQVMTRINLHFGVELAPRTLFAAPTVAGLALAITQAQAEAEPHIHQMLDEVEQVRDYSIQEFPQGR
jgi:acyl-coenzyme A synthetase/AMP-(fatty) acid ligase/acyl carrier protein